MQYLSIMDCCILYIVSVSAVHLLISSSYSHYNCANTYISQCYPCHCLSCCVVSEVISLLFVVLCCVSEVVCLSLLFVVLCVRGGGVVCLH